MECENKRRMNRYVMFSACVKTMVKWLSRIKIHIRYALNMKILKSMESVTTALISKIINTGHRCITQKTFDQSKNMFNIILQLNISLKSTYSFRRWYECARYAINKRWTKPVEKIFLFTFIRFAFLLFVLLLVKKALHIR